jgi:hypothetical protein
VGYDDQLPVLNVYSELYRLLGIEPSDGTGRDKSPCCERDTALPPIPRRCRGGVRRACRQGTKEQAPTDVTPSACREFGGGLHAGKRLFPVSGFLMTGASLDANYRNVA